MRSDELIVEQLLIESRIDFVKKKWRERGVSTAHDSLGKATAADDLVQHFADNADPSKSKQYTDRIMHWYEQGNIRQEDHPRIRAALEGFEKNRKSLPHQDIGKYGSFHELRGALQKLEGSGAPAAPEKGEFPWVKTTEGQRRAVQSGSEIVHDDDKHVVRRVDTHEAMKVLGSNTDWCVVPDKGTFNSYRSDGPLYHVHEKHSGRRWLVHHDTDQYMDEHDVDVRSHLQPGEPDEYEEGSMNTHDAADELGHRVPGYDEGEMTAGDQDGGPKNAREIIRTSKNPWAVARLAGNQYMPHDILHELSQHPDPYVVRAVAGNPAAHPETHKGLARASVEGRGHPRVGKTLAGGGGTAPEALAILADHGSDEVRSLVSVNSKTPAHALHHIAVGRGEFHGSVGMNPSAPGETLHHIIRENPVRLPGIYQNRAFSEDALDDAAHRIIKHYGGSMKSGGSQSLKFIMGNPKTGQRTVERVVNHEDPEVRRLAAYSPLLSEGHARKLVSEGDDVSRRKTARILLQNLSTTDLTRNFMVSTLSRDSLVSLLRDPIPHGMKFMRALARHPAPGVPTSKRFDDPTVIHRMVARSGLTHPDDLHHLATHSDDPGVWRNILEQRARAHESTIRHLEGRVEQAGG